jgi:insulysin
MNIASQMPYEDLATFPQKSYIPSQFDPKFLSKFLETLTPATCLYSVLADPGKTGIQPNKKEKWMNAEYAIKKISSPALTTWEAHSVDARIQLPSPNPYLPENIELISSSSTLESPVLLRSDAQTKSYYVSDTRYKVPEVSFLHTFKSPLIDHSAVSQVLLDLYIHAFSQKLSPTLSYAASAGLSSQILSDRLSFKIGINGYSDKAPLLMLKIFDGMTQVDCTAEEFAIYRTSLADSYNNASKELPVAQAKHQINGILMQMPTNEEKARAIQNITLEQFNDFKENLLQCVYRQSLFYGNIGQEEANFLDFSLSQALPCNDYPVEKHVKEKILLLSDANRPRKIILPTQRQGNGVVLLLQEGDFTFEKRGIQQILGKALENAFFDTLRTKQQTAYFAKAWDCEEQRQLLQFFAVQSSTHCASELLARFELFLEDFDKNLAERISLERFDSLRDNLITLISMPPENMPLMAARLNKFAFDYEDFSWVEKRVESLKQLSYERFCAVAHSLLARNNVRRLAVLMEGVLSPENDFRYESISKEDASRLGTFVTGPKNENLQ